MKKVVLIVGIWCSCSTRCGGGGFLSSPYFYGSYSFGSSQSYFTMRPQNTVGLNKIVYFSFIWWSKQQSRVDVTAQQTQMPRLLIVLFCSLESNVLVCTMEYICISAHGKKESIERTPFSFKSVIWKLHMSLLPTSQWPEPGFKWGWDMSFGRRSGTELKLLLVKKKGTVCFGDNW